MSTAQRLPQRTKTVPERPIPQAGPPIFQSAIEVDPACVAPDMADLATRVRQLMNVRRDQVLQLPLGGNFFDIVVTASGPEAYAAVAVMDGIQRVGDERPDACGPVIEDPQRSWLIWLVPPGTSAQWAPHRHAMCLGRPHHLALPAVTSTEPPGPYWLRPFRGDRLVPPAALRQLLEQFQPGPTLHEAVLGSLLSTIS
ncbi:hypothetical protein [Streptomyces sp. NPDC007206]|uniref:hypothetical protein n=1 Tax=Streptomyces sp. NPDC007206 TaxID=3154317 RepID=UPI0033D9F282